MSISAYGRPLAWQHQRHSLFGVRGFAPAAAGFQSEVPHTLQRIFLVLLLSGKQHAEFHPEFAMLKCIIFNGEFFK